MGDWCPGAPGLAYRPAGNPSRTDHRDYGRFPFGSRCDSARRRALAGLSKRLLPSGRLQDVIKEPVDPAVVAGPLGAETGPLFDPAEGGQNPPVEVLRAAPIHRGLDHELRAFLSNLATWEQLTDERSNLLGTIGAHSS